MFRYYVPPTFRDLDRMQRRMERMMNAFSPYNNEPAGYPALNVWVKDDDMIVTAELPGFTPESINLSVMGNNLTLSGSRAEEDLPEGAKYHRRECVSGEFNRTIRLPYNIDPEKVEASFDKGLLTIKLARAEADKPRKINIKSN
ncbi:MAG: Hsp20/alpha crystallin family protein [Anaerolineae bacterium]|nr:Hsp20/alpha crystallin family protein [Anaerolineae bacterium]